MKIVVLGSGYLGSTFAKYGVEVLSREDFTIDHGVFSTDQYLDATLNRYDVIINCIAKSNTRYCEEHFNEAYYSNATVPALLSSWCERNGKKFVQISTGCLYDKNNVQQTETDFLAAHCNYTLTKWIGEKNCQLTDLIIRPRLFFDDSARPNNLLNKVRKFERLVNRIDSLSSTDVVVAATLKLISSRCYGVFNVACDGFISMQAVGRLMGLEKEAIAIEEVRKQQGLYLVNSIMSLDKLKNYYVPPMVEDEIIRCLVNLPK